MAKETSLIELITQESALEHMASNYGLEGNEEQIFLGTVAEAIRSVITHNAREFDRPTNTAKISSYIRHISNCFPETVSFIENYSARDILDDMHKIGDILSLGNGEWWPVANRILAIPDSPICLLLGTSPNQCIQKEFKFESIGLVRVLSSTVNSGVNSKIAECQSFDSWIGRGHLDLGEWTKQFFSAEKDKLKSASFDDQEISVFTIEPQSKRTHPSWISLSKLSNPLDDFCLARFTHQQTGFDQYSYALVRIKHSSVNGVWKVRKHLTVRPDDARLLMHGLGQLSGSGLPVRIHKTKDGLLFSTLYKLPEQELRILSMAIPIKSESVYWQEYLFPRTLQPLLMVIVDRLGLSISNKNFGEELL